nr:PAS domain-containing protein [Micromonospora sp. DSM 115978]
AESDSAQSRTAGSGDDEVTTVVAREAGSGYFTGLQQRSAEMYGDLRDQQQQRDLTQAAVLAACILVLAAFGVFRQRSARRARARTNALLAGTLDLVLVADGASRRLTFVGAAAHELLGVVPEAVLGKPLTHLVHPDDAARMTELLNRPSGPPALGVRLLTAPGEAERWRWFDVEAA